MRSVIQTAALNKLNEAIVETVKVTGTGNPPSARARECMRLYWDLMFIYHHGWPVIDLPDIPRLANPPSIPPIPDDFLEVERGVTFELVNAIGDGGLVASPLKTLLNDQEIKLEAAKQHRERLGNALSAIDAEIERLGT